MAVKNRNERQFDEYRDWQWIKHLILGRYSWLWAEIVGKYSKEIIVVDTCAGAGSYADPDTGKVISEGSPVIFSRHAKDYTRRHGPGRSMRVICCEKNTNNHASLVEAVRPFEPHVKVLPVGGFEVYVPEIAAELGNVPALVLLDPIGIATIPADTWKPLLARTGKTDLFIVLHFAGLHRVGGFLREDGTPKPTIKQAAGAVRNMDRVFGGDPTWRSVALDPALHGEEHREARERRYVELFFEHVIGTRHTYKCFCEVRATYNAPIRYWLIHASDDKKPYTLMNDEIVKVNEILLNREYAAEGQIDGLAEGMRTVHDAQMEREIGKAAVAFVTERGGYARYGEIDEYLLGMFFGQVKSGVPWRVVKRLSKEQTLRREKNPGAAANEYEIIALPDVTPDASAEASKVVPIRRAA
jgi:three-Cys-motif partner protein